MKNDNMMRIGAFVLCAAALLGAATADAQPTKESLKCASAKLKAYGKDVVAKLKCYEKAVLKGVALDPACITKAETKTTDAFNKAELKGGCATEGAPATDLSAALQRNNDYLDAISAALAPNPGPNKCQATKLKEVGKLANKLFGCESKAAAKNGKVDQAKCVDKNVQKTIAAFAKAELKPPCDTTGDGVTSALGVKGIVEQQVRLTPRFNGCGNYLVLDPETCDDGNNDDVDACPADCNVAFCGLPFGPTYTVTVAISNPNVSAVSLVVDYDEGKVDLEGTSGDLPTATPLVGAGFAGNDYDHLVRWVAFDAVNFGSTDIVSFDFQACAGAPAPVPGDFPCTVLEATNQLGKKVAGVTCSVTIS